MIKILYSFSFTLSEGATYFSCKNWSLHDHDSDIQDKSLRAVNIKPLQTIKSVISVIIDA